MTNPARNRHLVEDLTSACRDLGEGLGDVPKMLRLVLEEEAWRAFTTALGEHVTHERFEEFAREKPLRGLGVDIGLVRRAVADDPGALDLLDQALAGRQGERTDLGNNVPEVGRPEGNSKAKALRRLRKEADAGNGEAAGLRDEVLAGRLSAHQAMVRAGFRPKTLTVPADRPESIARTLRKHLTPDRLRELRELLAEGNVL